MSLWRGDAGTAINTYRRPVFHWVSSPFSSLSSSYLRGDNSLQPSFSKVSSMSLLLELRGTSLTIKRVDCTSSPSEPTRKGFMSLTSTCKLTSTSLFFSQGSRYELRWFWGITARVPRFSGPLHCLWPCNLFTTSAHLEHFVIIIVIGLRQTPHLDE